MDDDSGAIDARLAETFATESQTIQRLLWSAEAADVDGYPELATSYRAIAEVKSGHAQGLLEFMADPDRTAENLAELIDNVDRSADLLRDAEQVRSAGREDLAEWFEMLAAASERHAERLREGKKTLR